MIGEDITIKKWKRQDDDDDDQHDDDGEEKETLKLIVIPVRWYV